MKSIAHQGTIKQTVTVAFEDGYSLTIEAGQEIALHVAVKGYFYSDKTCPHNWQIDGIARICPLCSKQEPVSRDDLARLHKAIMEATK